MISNLTAMGTVELLIIHTGSSWGPEEGLCRTQGRLVSVVLAEDSLGGIPWLFWFFSEF